MNRLIVVFLGLMLCAGIATAEDEYVNYQTFDTDGFTMFYVAAGTETAATYNVGTDSISMTVSGGFNPGTTTFQLAGATDQDTFLEFKAFMTARDNIASGVDISSDVCFQGSWSVNIPADVYEDYPMSTLDAAVDTGCLGIDNIQTLAIDTSSTTIMCLKIDGRSDRNIKIKYVISSITGTSPTIAIYNDDGNAMTPSATMTSGSALYFGVEDTNHPFSIGIKGQFVEIRTLTTAAMTDGYMLVGYTVE